MCRTRHLALAVFSLLTALSAPGGATAGDGKKVFRAGAFAMDITPPKLPISVNGGMQDRLAKAVHDRLHARCLVLDDGSTRVAFVVCDSCMIPREVVEVSNIETLDRGKDMLEMSRAEATDPLLAE